MNDPGLGTFMNPFIHFHNYLLIMHHTHSISLVCRNGGCGKVGWCLLDFLLACGVFLHFMKITFWDSSCLATLSYLLMKGLNTHKHIKKHFNNHLSQVFQWFSYCRILLGVMQCPQHFQSITPPSPSPPPQITQHQLCLVDFLPPMKELLRSSTSLKCPTVAAFAASIYTVNTPHCLLPLMLHSHFQMAQDSSVVSPKLELNQTKT